MIQQSTYALSKHQFNAVLGLAGQGARLVSQTNSMSSGLATNGWSTVPGGIDGSNGITIKRNNPTVFYKLVNP